MANQVTKHWGEIDDGDTYDSSFVPDVSVDIERSMNKFCLAEFDADYEEDLHQSEHVFLQSRDPLILYAISLHKHANDMSEMIRVAELAIESNLIPPADAVPVMPEIPQIEIRHLRNNLNFIPKEFTPFSLGYGPSPPEISSTVVKGILTNCVGTMLAHIGYETAHLSGLEMLTDVLTEFLKKITYRSKLAHDDEQKGQLCGFPNIAERILVELGMGGVREVNDYYQTRVINYVDVLQKRCQELSKHYESLLVGKSEPPEDKDNGIRVKREEDDDDVIEIENRQMHFDGEVGFSSLDAGYQLLSSLEAGANSQSLGEMEEDTSITISPGVVSLPEADLSSTLSPFTKKKRTK